MACGACNIFLKTVARHALRWGPAPHGGYQSPNPHLRSAPSKKRSSQQYFQMIIISVLAMSFAFSSAPRPAIELSHRIIHPFSNFRGVQRGDSVLPRVRPDSRRVP